MAIDMSEYLLDSSISTPEVSKSKQIAPLTEFMMELMSRPFHSVCKKHLIECENTIPLYREVGFEKIQQLLVHNDLLIKRLNDEQGLMNQSRYETLKTTAEVLKECRAYYGGRLPKISDSFKRNTF